VATVRTRAGPAPGAGKVTACTLPCTVPTNSVPCSPQVIARAFGTRATTSIAKPGGSLICSSGSVACAVASSAASAAKMAGSIVRLV